MTQRYEVQRLIKKHGWFFLLTGSSARKLQCGAANLLVGRAWMASLILSIENLLAYNREAEQYLKRIIRA